MRVEVGRGSWGGRGDAEGDKGDLRQLLYETRCILVFKMDAMESRRGSSY